MMSIKTAFLELAKINEKFISENEEIFMQVCDMIIKCLKNGKKLLIAGNGGSAADAQHLAAEIIGRYKIERNPLSAIALTTDTSILTAIGNDYGFDKIYSRQVDGLGNQGDIFIGVSTSGNSENIIEAVESSKKKGITTIGLLGKGGGKLKNIVDIALIIPSDNTPRIQECHQTIYHTICEYIDEAFKK